MSSPPATSPTLPSAGNFAGDRYFAAWSDPANGNQVEGRVVDADQTPLTGEFTVNNTANAGTCSSIRAWRA